MLEIKLYESEHVAKYMQELFEQVALDNTNSIEYRSFATQYLRAYKEAVDMEKENETITD